jgi:hypothetical protein
VALSLQQLRELLTQAVRARFSPGDEGWWWVLDVWPDEGYCIVEAPDDTLYKLTYTVTEQENGASVVTLGDQLVQVQRVVEYLPLTEGQVVVREALDESGWTWDVILIAPGLSENGVYYPPEVLEAAAPLFEGVRALARSDEEHVTDRGVSAVNIVGWYDNAHWVAGVGVIATFHITEDADWLRLKLSSAWAADKTDLIGFSLVAAGRGRRALYQGQLVTWVEALTKVDFVDIVVNPAAGGRVLQLVAGDAATRLHPWEEEHQMLQHLLRLLESRRPDLYATLDTSNVTEAQVLALLDSAVPVPVAAGSGADPAPQPVPVREATNPSLSEATAIIQRMELQERRLMLREALADCGLSDYMRTRVRNQFTRRLDAGQLFAEPDLTAAIAEAREIAGHFSESGRVRGFGADTAGARVTEEDDEKALQRLIDFFDGKTHSFKEAYSQVTGDRQIRANTLRTVKVRFGNWPKLAEAKGIRLVASLDSTSFDAVLADVMHKRMVAEYSLPQLATWRAIVVIGSVTDFKTQHRTRFGGYGNLPIVGEGDPYAALTSPSDEEATYVPRKRGGTEDLTWEMVRNDDANAIRFIPIRLGRAAAQTLHEFVFDFLATNPTIYDSVALFHSNHANLTSTALGTDDTQYLVHRLAMQKQTEAGSSKRLGLAPAYLVIPPDLESAAYNVFKRTTNNDPKFSQTVSPTIITVPYWTDTNNWFTVCDPMSCPTIEVAFLDGEEEPDIFVQEDETVGSMFTADKRTYKIRHTYGGAVLDYRGMQGAVVA